VSGHTYTGNCLAQRAAVCVHHNGTGKCDDCAPCPACSGPRARRFRLDAYLPTRGLPESNTPPGAPYGTGAAVVSCRQCGAAVELPRRCYAHPVCFACLPPPEPLPVRPARLTPEVIADRLERGRVNADALEEQLVRLTPGRALDLVLCGEDSR